MATTKARQIRIGDELWGRATARARREGTTPSELIRTFLDDYANDAVSVTEELNRIIARINEVRKRLER
jgi:antitoxin component of RelBE/YafQ-DinJ toxin-antitoxin module